MQRDPHQDGGVVEHARDAVSKSVVAPVMDEERIIRILAEALLRVLWGHGSCFTTVTGQTGAAVAAKRFALEEAPTPGR